MSLDHLGLVVPHMICEADEASLFLSFEHENYAITVQNLSIFKAWSGAPFMLYACK